MRPFAPIQNAALAAERDAMLDEIRRVFADVTREGGVSWSEADVIDGNGTAKAMSAARAACKDRGWTELAADESWAIHPGWGGFAFLDPIGFRYYLPAAMTRALLTLESATLDTSLIAHTHDKYKTKQLSLLTPDQCLCVARFLSLLDRIERDENDRKRSVATFWSWGPLDEGVSQWSSALNSRWKQLLPPEVSTS